MKRALRDLWALTLESGNYDQGFSYLRKVDGRCCCLGVLCDIVDPKGWSSAGSSFNHRASERRLGCNSPAGMPSIKFFKKIGLSPSDGLRLAKFNDLGRSFQTIAQEVRQLPVDDGDLI